jgi:Zn-dependent peptidase ImmA (M78 family)/DNA-binding XRE family transcriptional regulator
VFNPQRLVIGRKRRKLTARALASAIGVSPVTLSRLENGVNEPEEDTLSAIAEALGYPRKFFCGEDLDELPAEAASFRSLSSMTARERDAALSSGVIAYMFHDWIAARFNLPACAVPELRNEATPEAAAQIVRTNWGLGVQPVSSMIKLLESKGVRVFSLHEETKNVDAFSCWRGDTPFVFLNTFKSTERSRFDAAHELGHLVMHQHGAPQDSRQAEAEADRFASAFLMPADDVLSRIRYVADLGSLIAAKSRWGVSVAALNYRLHKLGVVSEWQNRSLNVELSSLGYRRWEPEGLPPETSALWPQIFSALWRERISRDHVAAALALPTAELDAILLRLTGAVAGDPVRPAQLSAIP